MLLKLKCRKHSITLNPKLPCLRIVWKSCLQFILPIYLLQYTAKTGVIQRPSPRIKAIYSYINNSLSVLIAVNAVHGWKWIEILLPKTCDHAYGGRSVILYRVVGFSHDQQVFGLLKKRKEITSLEYIIFILEYFTNTCFPTLKLIVKEFWTAMKNKYPRSARLSLSWYVLPGHLYIILALIKIPTLILNMRPIMDPYHHSDD